MHTPIELSNRMQLKGVVVKSPEAFPDGISMSFDVFQNITNLNISVITPLMQGITLGSIIYAEGILNADPDDNQLILDSSRIQILQHPQSPIQGQIDVLRIMREASKENQNQKEGSVPQDLRILKVNTQSESNNQNVNSQVTEQPIPQQPNQQFIQPMYDPTYGQQPYPNVPYPNQVFGHQHYGHPPYGQQPVYQQPYATQPVYQQPVYQQPMNNQMQQQPVTQMHAQQQEYAQQQQLAQQQEIARQQKLAQQQEIARQQELAQQQEVARQQELAQQENPDKEQKVENTKTNEANTTNNGESKAKYTVENFNC